MDNLNQERQIIERVLTEYIQFLDTYSYLESQLIISEDRNNYLIVLYGLLDGSYYHDIILNLEIQEESIYLIRDYIDIGHKLRTLGLSAYWQFDNFFRMDFAISLEKVYEQHKSIFMPTSNPNKPKIKSNATLEELSELSKIKSKYLFNEIARHPNFHIDLLPQLLPNFILEDISNFNLNLLTQYQIELIQSNDCDRIANFINDSIIPSDCKTNEFNTISRDFTKIIWNKYAYFCKICTRKSKYGSCQCNYIIGDY